MLRLTIEEKNKFQRILAMSLRLASVSVLLATATAAFAAPTRPQLKVTGYVINAELDPAASKLSATAQVTFTALEDLTAPTFELNNGLVVTSVTDAAKQPLTAERLTPQNAVRFSLNTPIAKGTSTTWTFTYAGVLKNADTSPVEGIKLAAIADPISILLYPGRWFPMSQTGLYTDRFTAEMHIRVPSDERVVGSGPAGKPQTVGSLAQYDFNWTRPGFPGTIVAGKFAPPQKVGNFTIYTTDARKSGALEFGQTATKEFEFMTTEFGQPEATAMSIVELPEDAVAASWGPGVIAIAGNRIVDHNSNRLLANTLAHQWFGSQISPSTLNDAWITNGMSRYAELMYLEDSAGKTAFQTAVGDVSAGALAYDTEPLSTMGRHDPFSPQFQSMTLEKGAMIFHMLRWEMGDDAFGKFLRALLTEYTDKPVRTRDVEATADAQKRERRRPFAQAVLRTVGRRHGSAAVQRQVHGLPTWKQQGFPHGRRNLAGSRPLPDAGRTAHRDRRQDRDAAGGCERHGQLLLGRDVWPPAPHHGGSAILGAEVDAGSRRPCGGAARPAACRPGRPDWSPGRVPEGARFQQEQLAGGLPYRRDLL